MNSYLSDIDALNRSMNGNALPGYARRANTQIKHQQQNSVAVMDNFNLGEYKPPVPVRRSIRKSRDKGTGERELWKTWMQNMEEDLYEYKDKAEKLQIMYERQKSLYEARTEDLLKMESKFVQLEKQCLTQENLITSMNQEQEKMSEELKAKSNKLEETKNELNSVMQKSEDLTKKLHEFEKELQASETARNIELQNLQCLQASFQASEKHFATVLDQVQNLVQENELAYETNCRLNQEKLKVERDLSLKNKMSTSLTSELAEAQEKMKQINNTLKTFENEKAFLYKKIHDLRILIRRLEDELVDKNSQLEEANQGKSDLEGQLKLANLCLSRALSGKDKANIFPQKSEVKTEAATSNGVFLPSIRLLQEEIRAKDKIIGRLIEENNNLEDEWQKCKMELMKQQEVNLASQFCFSKLHGAPKDLEHEINQRERIIDSMKLTIEKAISERNRLGLKCMRRKEQATLLKEKNKVLEEIMLIGNRLYEEGLKKIRNMKMAQENAFGTTLSLVGIVNSGNSRPGTPSCRQIMMRGNSEGKTALGVDGDSKQLTSDSNDSEMVMNI